MGRLLHGQGAPQRSNRIWQRRGPRNEPPRGHGGYLARQRQNVSTMRSKRAVLRFLLRILRVARFAMLPAT
jgi:hypothetical protein